MAGAESVRVEVAYALAHRQMVITVELPAGVTLRDAILHSGICRHFPEIDPDHCTAGVHGRPRALDSTLRDGDRVEIYRPLIADPRDSRRRRARGE